MNRDSLNQLILNLKNFRLAAFDIHNLSQTQVKNGVLLNLTANEDSLMMFIVAENLGKHSNLTSEMFERLLAANLLGGKLGNIRITYDTDTKTVWLCHDLNYEELTAESLDKELNAFINNSIYYRRYLRDLILSIEYGNTSAVTNTQNTIQTRIVGETDISSIKAMSQHQDIPPTAAKTSYLDSSTQSKTPESATLQDLIMNQGCFLMG